MSLVRQRLLPARCVAPGCVAILEDDAAVNDISTSIRANEARGSKHSAGDPILVGIREAAALLGIGTRKLHDLAQSGAVPSLKIGTRRLFPVEALKGWVAQQVKGGAA